MKDAAKERRTTTALIQETNDIAKATNDIAKAIQSVLSSKASYISVLTSNTAPLSKLIIISTQTSVFIQAQREIIVKITDLPTIESLQEKALETYRTTLTVRLSRAETNISNGSE